MHAHLYASAAAAALATAGTGTPLVVTEQTEAPWRGWLGLRVSGATHRRAAHVIAVSEAIAAGLRREAVSPRKISVIRNAVRPVAVPRTGAGQAQVKRPPTVGVVARLVPEKGLDVLLDAMPALRRHVPDVRVVVAGDGPLRSALEARARHLRLDGAIDFLGPRDDVPRLFGELDVLAVPSRAEGTPLTIVEAMWAGVPLVATTAGGIPEQLRDGVDALLVHPGDASGLAAALARVLTERGLAWRLVRSARARAEERYAYDGMVATIRARYVAVLGGWPSPSSQATARRARSAGTTCPPSNSTYETA